jgi:hypothetical protein
MMQHAHATRRRVVYVPEKTSDFNPFCRIAFAWAICGHDKRLKTSIIAEELADVTSPQKAPEGWGILLRQGMGFGANIYAVTQRPSESDKTVMGNASYLHTHYMQRQQDRVYMGREMDIEPEKIGNLQRYKYIERHNTGKIITN